MKTRVINRRRARSIGSRIRRVAIGDTFRPKFVAIVRPRWAP